MVGESGELTLCGRSGERGLVHVERAVFLAHIIECVAGAPCRRLVVAAECGEALEGAVGEEPDVASARALLVLAESVLEALAVLVEHALGAGGCRTHGDAQIQRGARAQRVGHVGLPQECAVGALLRGHDGCREDDVGIVGEGQRRLGTAVGGEAACASAACIGHVHVGRAHAVACECYEASVGAPHGMGVAGGAGGELPGVAACGGHCVDVALVGEGHRRAVGRDGRVAQPQRPLGGSGRQGSGHCRQCDDSFHIEIYIIYIYL